jgi:protein-S-isoprenylcysteine O-methyltransferase Ste14
MQRSRAAIGSAVFFVVAPGTVAGLIPWLITRWEFREPLPYWIFAQLLGTLLILGGLILLVHAFVEFVRADGTPLPAAAPPNLVVTGFNRHVRNPMYVGVVAIIVGQSLLFGQFRLLVYALVVWLLFASFVRFYEEPTLTRRFGSDYEGYRRGVPAWLPRSRPWTPPVQ